MSGMRAVSFFGPEESESGAGLTGNGLGGAGGGAGTGFETADGFGKATGEGGAGGGGGGGKNWAGATGSTGGFGAVDGFIAGPTGNLSDGGRGGSWMRTVSRDFVLAPGGFPPGWGVRAMRTVSFLGSFGSVIRRASRS